MGAGVPVQKGTVLCVLTSATDAEDRGDRPRMVLIEVNEVSTGRHGQHAGHLVDGAGVTRPVCERRRGAPDRMSGAPRDTCEETFP